MSHADFVELDDGPHTLALGWRLPEGPGCGGAAKKGIFFSYKRPSATGLSSQRFECPLSCVDFFPKEVCLSLGKAGATPRWRCAARGDGNERGRALGRDYEHGATSIRPVSPRRADRPCRHPPDACIEPRVRSHLCAGAPRPT